MTSEQLVRVYERARAEVEKHAAAKRESAEGRRDEVVTVATVPGVGPGGRDKIEVESMEALDDDLVLVRSVSGDHVLVGASDVVLRVFLRR